MNAALTIFNRQSYLNLETFRKTGQGVPTPVWFVEHNGKLYVRSGAASGKIKRLRHTQRVRIAPCSANGTLTGEWIEAQARVIADTATEERISQLKQKKYGLQKMLFDVLARIGRRPWATIEITLA